MDPITHHRFNFAYPQAHQEPNDLVQRRRQEGNIPSAITELLNWICSPRSDDFSIIYRHLIELLPVLDAAQFARLEVNLINPFLRISTAHIDEQRALAFQFAKRKEREADSLPFEQSKDFYLRAMHFFAQARELGHQDQTSRLLLKTFKRSGAFKHSLEMALARRDLDALQRDLHRLEQWNIFCSCEESFRVLESLYLEVGEVLTEYIGKPNYGERYIATLQEVAQVERERRARLRAPVEFANPLNYQARLQEWRDLFRSFSSEDPSEVRVFQREVFDRFKDLFMVFINDLEALLGPIPLYDFRAVGSLGRQEPSPLSDLEFFVLYNEERHKDQIELFTFFLNLQIHSMGEGDYAPRFVNRASGFHLDGKDFEDYRSTPQKVASHQFVDTDLSGLNIPERTCLKSSSLHSTDPTLISRFNECVRGIWSSSRKRRAIRFLELRHLAYKTSSSATNIKERYFEPLVHLVTDLSHYWNIEETNTLDIVDRLEERGILSKKSAALLKEGCAAVYALRLRLYFEEQDPNEKISIEEQKQLERLEHLVLKPLYDLLKKGIEGYLNLYINSVKEANQNLAEIFNLAFDQLEDSDEAATSILELKKFQQLFHDTQKCKGSIALEKDFEKPYLALIKNIESSKNLKKDEILSRLKQAIVASKQSQLTQLEQRLEEGYQLFEALFTQVDFIEIAFNLRLVSEDCNDPSLKLIAESTDDPAGYYERLAQSTNQSMMQQFYYAIHDHDIRKKIECVPNRAGYRIAMDLAEKRVLERIFNITTERPLPSENQVCVTGFSFCRWLDPAHLSKLLDCEGKVQKKQGSLHNVANSCGLYFKMTPSNPLMEHAIHNLFFRLGGSLTPATILVRFDGIWNEKPFSYPVLISEEIEGATFEEVTIDQLHCSLVFEEARDQWTWLFLGSILTRPGDGRPSNYVLKNGLFPYSVDNDGSFVEPVRKSWTRRTQINFHTVLFCVDTTLSSSVVQAFLKLDATAILRAWSAGMVTQQSIYRSLFSEEDLKRFFNEDPKRRFRASLLFKEGALSGLFNQFQHLKRVLSSPNSLSSLELLSHIITQSDGLTHPVGSFVEEFYRSSLKGQTVNERWALIHKGPSLSSSEIDQKSFGRAITFKDTQSKGLTLIEAVEEYQALVHDESDSCQVDLGEFSDERQVDTLNRLALHWKKSRGGPVVLSIRNCSVLNAKILDRFLSPSLEVLKIDTCREFDDRFLANVMQRCPKLRKLSLERLNRLTSLGQGGLGLEQLHIEGCPFIKRIHLHYPSLHSLTLLENSGLMEVTITDHPFPYTYGRECPKLKFQFPEIENIEVLFSDQTQFANAFDFYLRVADDINFRHLSRSFSEEWIATCERSLENIRSGNLSFDPTEEMSGVCIRGLSSRRKEAARLSAWFLLKKFKLRIPEALLILIDILKYGETHAAEVIELINTYAPKDKEVVLPVIQALKAALAQESYLFLKRRAIDALKAIDPVDPDALREAVTELVAALKIPDEYVRERAVSALGELKTTDAAIQRIVKSALTAVARDDSDPRLRELASSTLVTFREELLKEAFPISSGIQNRHRNSSGSYTIGSLKSEDPF